MAGDVPDVYVKLDGLTGECTDFQHAGKDGWVQIKGFSFSFGLKSNAAEEKTKAKTPAPGTPQPPGTPAGAQTQAGTHPGPTTTATSTSGPTDEGPFDRPQVTLSKGLDLASPNIWKQKCYDGEPIPTLEVQACRYGEGTDEKVPFLRMLFQNVSIRSVSLQISEDGMPSESIQFIYDAVHLQYIWTSNDTGARVRGGSAPRAGWNFKDNKAAPWPLSD